MKKYSRVVAVSGGFDPLHIGHVRMFGAAKKLGDRLVVIVNNDHWLKAKKGFVFMPEAERVEIIKAIAGVDKVVLTRHAPADADRSVCRELARLAPAVFANGGDRKPSGDPVPEVALCKALGIRLVYNVGRGGKVLFLMADGPSSAETSPSTTKSLRLPACAILAGYQPPRAALPK